jgi:hypothetical protein
VAEGLVDGVAEGLVDGVAEGLVDGVAEGLADGVSDLAVHCSGGLGKGDRNTGEFAPGGVNAILAIGSMAHKM